MDIELLKTFLEVHKTRHFGRAADNLHLTSAAVSARIKQLEQYLGVTLFVRKRGNIQLTSEGERLLPLAETLTLTWSRALQEVSLETSRRSRLHIGATSGLWQFSLENKLIELTRAMPDIAIQAEGHSGAQLVRRLSDRTLDIVLLYEPPASADLRAEKVGQLKLVMAATDADKSVRDALRSGYVYVDWGSAFAMFHAKRHGEVPPAALTVNLASIALSYLKENPGSAYLPHTVLERSPYLHAVKDAPVFVRSIYATCREGHDQPELLGRVIGLLQGLSV